MESSRNVWLLAAVLMYLAGLAAGSTFLSDTVLELHGSAGRSLLQAKTSCPIDFEGMNYTIITGKCKATSTSMESTHLGSLPVNAVKARKGWLVLPLPRRSRRVAIQVQTLQLSHFFFLFRCYCGMVLTFLHT
ncbi:hypothetical protein OPV22_026479 [Ensete ventricosum]|uniref:Uncharacterized protein n=1 Tax=Ensete ventricosum TaxID=4639 RepID=A0AAV8PAT5_ENSVE|nr:hypothetical protein OPV22_026479 [Ensete ventricosum]